MRHTCTQKQRAEEIRSPNGQAAFSFYNEWMKQKKFKEQSIDAFLASRYYRMFLNFAAMVKAAGIHEPIRYVALMVEKSWSPDLWCRPDAYRAYLEWVDKVESPMNQVASSIKVLMDIADKEEIGYGDVIKFLGSQKILHLIHQRKLSPWFVMNSTTMHNMLRALEREELNAFGRAININVWAARLEEHKELRTEIRALITEIGL